VVGLHLPGLSDAWSASPSSSDYLADPAVFCSVKFMELGIVVPGMVTIAFGILRGARWARVAKYAAVGWLALLGSSVAGMAVVMRAAGDPAATVVNTVAFGAFAAVGLTVAIGLYRKLFTRPAGEPETYQLSGGRPIQSELDGRMNPDRPQSAWDQRRCDGDRR
jgi:hypothetical protein